MIAPARVRIRRPIRLTGRFVVIPRLVSLLGCAFALQPSPASAQVRPVPPAGAALDTAPPWSEPGGYPPPLPLGRTRTAPPVRHPALHPRPETAAAPLTPLFPRAADVAERKAARRAAMERHPAGKGIGRSNLPASEPRRAGPTSNSNEKSRAGSDPVRSTETSTGATHRVRPGETLWGIAERRCGSERPIDILRLTMEIHRLNRQVIGSDPDLILPGQLLSLPKSCTR